MNGEKHLIILGDGAAGIILANKTRMKTRNKDLTITVIGNSPKHYFKPDGIQIPLGFKDYRDSVKPTRFLLNYGIEYIADEVTLVNIEERKVYTRSGRTVIYDYLVIATGDRFTPEDVPGYDSEAKHFYDLEHANELKECIRDFDHGSIVIGRAGEPIQCPPAPFEMTLLLDQYFRSKGIRDDVDIHYLYPMDGTFSLSNVSKLISSIFKERNIANHPNFNVECISPKSRIINSYEGESVKYNLLILVPPHRGQQFLTDSQLADEYGYVDVDKKKLNYSTYDDVFVIGDATNLPIAKAGSVAHLQAGYLAGRIASEIAGYPSEEGYSGLVECFVETGMEKGMTLYYSHSMPPKVRFTSKFDHFLKWSSSDTYFSGMLRGLL